MKQETRKFTVQKASDDDALTFRASLSSEYPVQRGWGWEILAHTPDGVNMERAGSGLPLLANHNSQDPVGVAEKIGLEAGRLVADLRFFSTARGREFATMVGEGLSGVSIGYTVDDMVAEGECDGSPVYRVTRFTPFEISIAPVAADPTVGVGRSRPTLSLRGKRVDQDNPNPTQSVLDERTRIASIMDLAREYRQEELADNFIQHGRSVDDFRVVLEQIASQAPPTRDQETRSIRPFGSGSPPGGRAIGMSDHELEEYSLVRALRATIDPKYREEAGFEFDVSRALGDSLGRHSKGLLVPMDALSVRSVAKSTTGGNLVPTEYMAAQFIDVLRARSFVMDHATTLSGLGGDVDIPKKSTTGTAYWIEGDDADSLTNSDSTFSKVSLSPRTVGALTTFSHKMLVQSSPDIEQLVRIDLAATVASEIDKQALQGDGANHKPLGVFNTPGVGADTFANATIPTFADVVAMEGALALDNADMGHLVYLADPVMMSALKRTEKASNTAQFIWTAGKERGEGMMNGLPARYTAHCPVNKLVLGNWADLLVGLWGVIEVDADPYGSNFSKGSVTIRALMDVDVAVRREQSFTILEEASP